MADSKRQSAKVAPATPATPNVGAAGMASIETALSGVVGARIRLTTAHTAQTLEGTVFTYCPLTHLLAINTAPPPPTPAPAAGSTSEQLPGDYHIIPVSKIQSFNLLSARSKADGGAFESAQPAIAPVDMRALKAREEAAVRRLKEVEARRGKGVGKEGQDIFDAFARTLPTRWEGTSINVLDAVTISPPYRVEDCKAAPNHRNALNRVKTVLESERKKLDARPRRSGTPSAGAGVANTNAGTPGAEKGGPRKGG
ncbi:MAG: hypothetical protein M1819_002410 [Sarea resinae]|nr:MAG: hypothetical protein M1819_002410 [Sarea resinae]